MTKRFTPSVKNTPGFLEYDPERGFQYRFLQYERAELLLKQRRFDTFLRLVGKSSIQSQIFPDDPLPSEEKLFAALSNAWRNHVRDALNQIDPVMLLDPDAIVTQLFDPSAGVRIRDDVLQQFYAPLRAELGERFAQTIDPKLNKALTGIYQAASNRIGDKYQLALPAFDVRDQETVNALRKNTIFWITSAHERVIEPELNRILADIVGQGLGVKEGSEAIRSALRDRYNLMDHHWDVIASAAINRSRNFSQVNQYDKIGIEAYEIVAVLDERTTEICTFMNGKVFKVRKAADKIKNMNNMTDPAQIKQAMPWMRFDSKRAANGQPALYTLNDGGGRIYVPESTFKMGTAEDIDNVFLAGNDTPKWIPSGRNIPNLLDRSELELPPYHGNCRTSSVVSEESITVEMKTGQESPTPIEPNKNQKGTTEYYRKQLDDINTKLKDLHDNYPQYLKNPMVFPLRQYYNAIDRASMGKQQTKVIKDYIKLREQSYGTYLKYYETLDAKGKAKELDVLVEEFLVSNTKTNIKKYRKKVRESIDPVPIEYLARLKQERLEIKIRSQKKNSALGSFTAFDRRIEINSARLNGRPNDLFYEAVRHEFGHAIDAITSDSNGIIPDQSAFGFFEGWNSKKFGARKRLSGDLKKIYNSQVVGRRPILGGAYDYGSFLTAYEGRVYPWGHGKSVTGLEFFSVNSERYLTTKAKALENYKNLTDIKNKNDRIKEAIKLAENTASSKDGQFVSWSIVRKEYGAKIDKVFENLYGSHKDYIIEREGL